MTDPALVRKKLAQIETFIRELRTHGEPERLEVDLTQARFVQHTLQIAIQAALDLASHIVSDDRLGEPETNRQLFEILANEGWISADLARRLSAMAGFRNLLVHGYAEVDLSLVRAIAEGDSGDLLELVAAVESRLTD